MLVSSISTLTNDSGKLSHFAEQHLAQQLKLRALIEDAEQSHFVEWENIDEEIDRIFGNAK